MIPRIWGFRTEWDIYILYFVLHDNFSFTTMESCHLNPNGRSVGLCDNHDDTIIIISCDYCDNEFYIIGNFVQTISILKVSRW